MSDALTLLVRSWANRLERELEILRAALPENLPLERHDCERVYQGPRGWLGMTSVADHENPANWVEGPGDYLALDGLKQMLDELRQAEHDLVGDEREAT